MPSKMNGNTESSNSFSYQSSIERARRIKAENALSKAAEANLRPYQAAKATLREEMENAQRVFLTTEMKRTALEAFKAEHKDEVLATLRKELAGPAFEAMKREKYGEAMLTLRAENYEKAVGELRDNLREKVKAELREELYDDVRKTLKMKLRDSVIEDLRAELLTEVRAEVRADLEPVIAAEIRRDNIQMVDKVLHRKQQGDTAEGYDANDGPNEDFNGEETLYHEHQDDFVDRYDDEDGEDDISGRHDSDDSDAKKKPLNYGNALDEEDSRGRRRWRDGSGPEAALINAQASIIEENAEEFEPDPVDPALTFIQSTIEVEGVEFEPAPVNPSTSEKRDLEEAFPSTAEDNEQLHIDPPLKRRGSHEGLLQDLKEDLKHSNVDPVVKRKRSHEETLGTEEMDKALGLGAKRHRGEDVVDAEDQEEEYDPEQSGLTSFGIYAQYRHEERNAVDELLMLKTEIGIGYTQEYVEYNESEGFEGGYEDLEGGNEEIDDNYEGGMKFSSFKAVGNKVSEGDDEDSLDEGSGDEDDDDGEEDNEADDEDGYDEDEDEDDEGGEEANREESALRSRGASVNDAIELLDSDEG